MDPKEEQKRLAAEQRQKDKEARKAEQEERKQEAKAQLEAEKKTPQYQAQQWLNGVAKVMQSIEDAKKESNVSTHLPAELSQTWCSTFDDTLEKLKKLREALEDALAGETSADIKKTLAEADKLMIQSTADRKAWRSTLKIYKGSAK